MAYTPPPSPGSLRSPRNRALEIGTQRAGFVDVMPFHTQAGIPEGTHGASGTYQSQGPFVSEQGSPINTPVPFTGMTKK